MSMAAERASLPITLECRRTANGGGEWFLAVDGKPVYPFPEHGVGIFAGPDAKPENMLRRLLQGAQ